MNQTREPAPPLSEIQPEWGQRDKEHFGYASDEERKAKRGLEDWELLESVPLSQKPVPYWFFAVIVVVLLVAVGLAFPFWGTRPGHQKHWLDWGFLLALVYIAGAGTFVYFMVRMYGAAHPGPSEAVSQNGKDPAETQPQKTTDEVR
ncbi:MAG: hypothetical protein GJU73_01145 [Ferrovum sp.]|jgi:hypothetical protein|uniref:hypothetical protein n=1 Tax=Ferrovum sp. TaxID=2609467 RepID=UPI00260DDDEF|nr:hypothetical protein [Ferrovum sp.]MBW8066024.1 hypothetical protein [Ferrovum sp.]